MNAARRRAAAAPKGAAARVRADLAACYRLVAHFRMTDLIYTHVSARLPGREPRFLINPYGLLFEE
ncbi:MAG TPA: class II aldolase/adducin family protein, partial [Casimicrobiaceae bacterium]|nr:class II aldolase/adducin family protein [Casimicrobiaceae bacterium]